MKDSIPSPTFFHKERAAAAALFLCVIEAKCICEAYAVKYLYCPRIYAKGQYRYFTVYLPSADMILCRDRIMSMQRSGMRMMRISNSYTTSAQLPKPRIHLISALPSVKYHLSTLSSSPVTGLRYLIKSEL